MTGLELSGLDGSNPLAFLAALGVLAAVEEQQTKVSLSWIDSGTWHPNLQGFPGSIDDLIDLLDRDRNALGSEPALDLKYGSDERDLKPPPEIFQQYLTHLVAAAMPQSRRSVDWAAAFATDVAKDNSGKTKPTALHFTAGQQKFLAMARDLQASVTVDDLNEALLGPWRYQRSLPVLGWDATTSRDYALRASDPSQDKKLGVPGADWLALRGLSFITVFPDGERIITTGCRGGWKSGRFRWPLWRVPLNSDLVRSLLRIDIVQSTPAEQQALGVGMIFECAIRRSDQGGYGSFSPPRPVL